MPENVNGSNNKIGFISQRAAPSVRNAGRPLAHGLHNAEGVKNAFEALLLGQLMRPLQESLSRSGLFPDGAAGDIYNHFWQTHMSSILAESVDLVPGWKPGAEDTETPDDAISRASSSPIPLSSPDQTMPLGPLPASEVPLPGSGINGIRGLDQSDHQIMSEGAGLRWRSIQNLPVVPGAAKPVAVSPADPPPHLKPLTRALAPYDQIIKQAAADSGVDANWLRAVIIQESGGRPEVVSSKGATGLMQLMPATALSLGVVDSLNPVENINGGARYLGAMQRRFGDPRLAFAAYNAGPTRVDECGAVPAIRETQNYVKRVVSLIEEFDLIWPPGDPRGGE